jgi:cytochrome c oxidase subunit 2
MKKGIIIFVAILALMEGVSWWTYTSFNSEEDEPETVFEREQDPITSPDSAAINTPEQQRKTSQEDSPKETDKRSSSSEPSLSKLPSKWAGSDSESFPPPSTEVVNGITERTIHMGVRQYVWEPATITVKYGELVRLIIHNADVKHGLVIPDLGVNQDIPPDGAVVEFMASKTGTFEFFCSVWCGEGHMEMRGKIVIQ